MAPSRAVVCTIVGKTSPGAIAAALDKGPRAP